MFLFKKKAAKAPLLPAYQPTITPAESHDRFFEATADAINSLPPTDPIRVLLELRRQHPPSHRSPFLDIERIAQCRHEHADTAAFVRACETELAIMYAMYPDGCDQSHLHLIARVIAIPDSLIYEPAVSEEWLKGFLERRSLLRDLVERVKQQRLSLCKQLKNDKTRSQVVNEVLPLMDKADTLSDTIKNMTAMATPIASVECGHVVKRLKWFTVTIPHKLVLLPRHIIVFRVHRTANSLYKLHVPVDAVRMRKVNNDGLIVLCVDHLGIVMNIRCSPGDADLLVDSHSELLDRTTTTFVEQQECVKTTPIVANDKYRDIVEWPRPHRSPSTLLQSGVIHSAATKLSDTLCALYKFTEGTWQSMGRCRLAVEPAADSGEWLLVLRSVETGVVRLAHCLGGTVEVYPQQRSFSVLHHSDTEGKQVFQVKVKEDSCVTKIQQVIEHLTVCREELSQWRQADRMNDTVLAQVCECQLTVVRTDSQLKQYSAGALNLLKTGKFEYDHEEGVLIGWVGSVWMEPGEPGLVFAHGAILTESRHSQNTITWCTITISCPPPAAAYLLHHSTAITPDYTTDLIAQLTSSTAVTVTVNVTETEDKGAVFEDDLLLSHIFTSDDAGKRVVKGDSFEQTPIGRLWAFGLDTLL